jgi:hypothetical protein
MVGKESRRAKLVCAIAVPPVPEREVVRVIVLWRVREARQRRDGACADVRWCAGATGG